MPQPLIPKKLISSMRPGRPLRTNIKKKKKDDSNPIHHRDWNTKAGSQEMPGIKASLALEYKMKQGKG